MSSCLPGSGTIAVRLLTALFSVTVLLLSSGVTSRAAVGSEVQRRIDRDAGEGRAVVIHVTVPLCDNRYQGIVPVPAHLGNGQDPKSNLYWGALFGLKTFLQRSGGWVPLTVKRDVDDRILDQIVLRKEIERGGRPVEVFIVADAWDGKEIKEAVRRFLDMAAGKRRELVVVGDGGPSGTLEAGGSAHLVAYIGHDGLMDFSLPPPVPPRESGQPRSALVLACLSRRYFQKHLDQAGAHALLMTTGLMAPEAYTFDAAVTVWISQGKTGEVREAAARAYDKYQGCGLRGARNLFWGAE